MSAAGSAKSPGPPAKVPVVFGEVLFDCFEDGARVLGGAPFNAAWHLQGFGRAPMFVSRVGDDAMGREIRDAMQVWGMSTAGLQQDARCRTGEVRVTLGGGQPSFEIMTERAWDHIAPDMLPPLAAALIYHGSLALRHANSSSALDALLARQPDAPLFIDVNLRPPWSDVRQLARRLDRAHWVKVNDAELGVLVPEAGDRATKAARLMDRHELRLLVVTRGEKGAFAREQNGVISTVAPPTQNLVVDTVGAGDGFAAVCLVGLLENWPVPLTLERAQRFASVLVTRRGATLREPLVYRQMLDNWQR